MKRNTLKTLLSIIILCMMTTIFVFGHTSVSGEMDTGIETTTDDMESISVNNVVEDQKESDYSIEQLYAEFRRPAVQNLPSQSNELYIIDEISNDATVEQIEENIIIPEEDNIIMETPNEEIYVIKKGDSLFKIAAKFYGNGSYYGALSKYNGIDPTKYIYPGQELKIPDISILNSSVISASKMATIPNTQSPLLEQPQSEEIEKRDIEIDDISKPLFSDYSDMIIPASNITNPAIRPSSFNPVKNYTEEVDTSNLEFLGNYKITGYDPWCAHCCGRVTGKTASGAPAVVGRSIAIKGIPYGTKVYIEGYGFYVNEDTGSFKSDTVDIACKSHTECYSITVTSRSIGVWIIG